MGRLAPAWAALWVATAWLALAPAVVSCASRSSEGFTYTVKPGDNLYRIGLRFGVSSGTLVRVNKIRDVTSVAVGTRLWIPGSRSRGTAAAQNLEAAHKARQQARDEAQSQSKLDFVWPVRGKLTSPYGRRRGGFHDGVDLAAKRGTSIYAAEAGKVIHSGRLGAYGRVVIVKHAGDYRSVYAHARKLYAREGQFVERGERIAEVGTSGNASGPHVHFEIRRGETPRDPMPYLR